MLSLWTLMIFPLWPFFYSCILCLFHSTFTAYLSFIFPWYFPEKSGNICLFFRHVSFTIQWIFILLNYLLSYPIRIRLFIRIFIFVIYSDIIIHLFIRILIGLVPCSLSCLAIRYFLIYLFVISYCFVVSSELFSILIYLLFRVLFLC